MVKQKTNIVSSNTTSSHHNSSGSSDIPQSSMKKKLPPAAQRALKEAKQRRSKIDNERVCNQKEINGRGGLDPVRYNDWEVKGLATDF